MFILQDLDYLELSHKNNKIRGSESRAIAIANFFADPGENDRVDFALITGVNVGDKFSGAISESFVHLYSI
ncbi:MAG: hypothetical protein AB4372_01010 [Xenococcus sp. (in: cyanobacteria)]